MGRYDLNETEWRLIEPLLSERAAMGLRRVDDRHFINGIFYVLSCASSRRSPGNLRNRCN
jgi:transposase